MALITKPHTFAASAVIVASEHNSNFDTIYNDYNGGITNANCSASMALVDTKLDEIKTANKVNITAVGSLAGLTAKTTIHDDDIFLLGDSEASNARKKLAYSVVKPSAANALSGSVIKTGRYSTGTYKNCANVKPIPRDNTKPQDDEGDEVMEYKYTPALSTSTLRVEVAVCGEFASTTFGHIALFIGAGSDAVQTAAMSEIDTGHLTYEYAPGSTNEITFKVRAGQPTAGYRFHFNGKASEALFDGTFISSITVTEIKA